MNRRSVLAGLGVAATSGCLRLSEEEATSQTEESTTRAETEAQTATESTTTDEQEGTDDGSSELETVVVGPGGDLVFDPEELVVEPGTTVRWTWDSDNHDIAVETQPADADWSGHETIEDEGFEYEHTFEVLGEYEYHCRPHHAAGMEATVTVTDRPGESGNTYESETSIDAVADDWGQFAFDATNVGASATSGPSELLPAWRHEFEEGSSMRNAPAVSAGRVFASTDQRLFAFDATTGEVEWARTRPDDPFMGGVAVVDGTAYVSRKTSVSAHEAVTGDVEWSTDVGVRVSPPVTATSDAVAVSLVDGADSGGFALLDAATGDRRWSLDVDASTYWPPAIAGSSVYVQTEAPKVASLDAATGDVEWTFDADEYPTTPTVVGDVVYVLDRGSGTASALAAESGEELWSVDVGTEGVGSPVVVDGLVMGFAQADDELSMWAIDADSGDERWRRTGVDSNVFSPAVADGRLYTTDGTTVRASDVEDGSLVAERSLAVPDGFIGPVVADGVVFVGGNELHAFAGP